MEREGGGGRRRGEKKEKIRLNKAPKGKMSQSDYTSDNGINYVNTRGCVESLHYQWSILGRSTIS